MNQKKEPRSLKKRLLTFMILCWLVPIAVFFAFTTMSYHRGIVSKAENLMEQKMTTAASVLSIRLNEAISLSRRPSYENEWEDSWGRYYRETISRTDFLLEMKANLVSDFYLDNRFDSYAFYMEDSKTPECFGFRTGRSFANFVDEAQEGIDEIRELDSNYVYVRVIEGKIYIVRNLYTKARYTKFGTLVLELNRNKVYQDIPTELMEGMAICINDANDSIYFCETDVAGGEERLEALQQMNMEYDGIANKKWLRAEMGAYNCYLYQKGYDNYNVGIITSIKRSDIYDSLYTVYKIVFVVLVLVIPLMSFGIVFLWKQIQIPIKRLVSASNRIEEGEIGTQITGDGMPNKEFAYLMDSFNSMSMQVKELFDTAYTEKLARKDAQILALQAQINPHFLNNTLEMMNWQARMSGDTVVSKMIEALGTVLDYRMNRSNVKKIRLTEELYCADAYFYIMSMRFGQRLQIIREIDDSLLYINVPPLVLQPIVENAIVHGVEAVKNGVIELRIFHDEENVYLRVINSGKPLTEKDQQKINAILNEDADKIPKQPGHHVSIGISNVNKRIKLVYGDEYGLTIERGEDARTVSTVTIPYMEGK